MTVAISRAARDRRARRDLRQHRQHVGVARRVCRARAACAAVVLVPATGISAAKVAQTLDYGATVVAIDGDFDAALVAGARARSAPRRDRELGQPVSHRRAEDGGVRAARSARLARAGLGRLAGRKSRQHERARQRFSRGARAGLDRSSAAHGGRAGVRRRAVRARLPRREPNSFRCTPRRPRPRSRSARRRRGRRPEPRSPPRSGTVLDVSDDAIADARAIVGRDGIGCEPASAATLAGLRQLVGEGTIGAGDDVVLILTGHSSKTARTRRTITRARHRSPTASCAASIPPRSSTASTPPREGGSPSAFRRRARIWDQVSTRSGSRWICAFAPTSRCSTPALSRPGNFPAREAPTHGGLRDEMLRAMRTLFAERRSNAAAARDRGRQSDSARPRTRRQRGRCRVGSRDRGGAARSPARRSRNSRAR